MKGLAQVGILRIREALRALGVARVMVWGYRTPSHTHHWVMLAIHRALEHALRGDPAAPALLWLDNRTVGDPAVFDDALVLGNVNVDHVDHCLPIRRRGLYLMHDHAPGRLDLSRYAALRPAGRVLVYEVFRARPPATFTAIADQPLCYVDAAGEQVVMPWATDLLPHEIEQCWDAVVARGPRSGPREVVFVGSSWKANSTELVSLARETIARGIHYQHYGRELVPTAWPDDPLVHIHRGSISMAENIARVRKATLAPALQGEHQLRNPEGPEPGQGNYVPCRIFKNISYGALGVSNNPTVEAVLGDAVVCRSDIGEMLDAALEREAGDPQRAGLREGMAVVAGTHTYLNRLAMLLELACARHEACGRRLAELRDDAGLRLSWRRVVHSTLGRGWQ